MSREYVRIDHTSQAQVSPIESCMKEPGLAGGLLLASPRRCSRISRQHGWCSSQHSAPCVAAAGPRLEGRLNSPESLDPCKLWDIYYKEHYKSWPNISIPISPRTSCNLPCILLAFYSKKTIIQLCIILIFQFQTMILHKHTSYR